MSGNRRADKIIRLLWIFLILGSVLAAVKVIFVDYTLDEEYQVVMSYRNVTGDTLFGTMWEPHQTSAFLCVWLMRIYMAVAGTTTGVVVFLRICTTAIQFLLSFWIYRTFRKNLGSSYALLIGILYFNTVPKVIQIPEFANLQVWACTVAVLALMDYYGENGADGADGKKSRRRLLWLAVAGLGMAAAVLAYPASLLLFPFFLLYIGWRSAREAGGIKAGLRDAALFGGTCGCCALVWLWRVLSKVTAEEFWRNLQYVIRFDATHDMSLGAEYRMPALFRDFKIFVVLLAIDFAAACVIRWAVTGLVRRSGKGEECSKKAVLAVCMILSGELIQLWYWLGFLAGYEIPQMHLILVLLGAILLWKDAGEGRRLLGMGLIAGLLIILSVLYMSDLGLWYAIPHGLPGVIAGVAVIVTALTKRGDGQGKFWAYLLLFSLAFVSVFGKGFILRAGMTESNTILGVRGIIRKGPAAGILTNYMQAYITNETYDEFQAYVKPGSRCLIVTNVIGTAGTSPYLFTGSEICHFSIVDPTTYDEKLLEYWQLYPGKVPEVIVVDCWYGQLREDPDSWIMRYIEEEFGYSEAIDGKYVRYYIR